MALTALVALALLGWFVSWRDNTTRLRAERCRSERFRDALVEGSRLAVLAKDVQCPTCLANWASMRDVCDIGIVAGDAAGMRKKIHGTNPSG